MKTPVVPLLVLYAACVAIGCDGSPAVSGGTEGVLRAGAVTLGEIQVTVHRMDGPTPRAVGFGVSGLDGRFNLIQNGAAGPLWLTPGEYRCTVESVGPDMLLFPPQYAKAESSPLKVVWSGTEQALDLDVPMPRLAR